MKKHYDILAKDYAPPEPWTRLSFRLGVFGHKGRLETVVAGGLSDSELEWIGRVIIAEMQRRKSAKLVEGKSDIDYNYAENKGRETVATFPPLEHKAG